MPKNQTDLPSPTARPLRICMLLDRYLPIIGGAELQASQLVRLLMQDGHDVIVVTRRLTDDLPRYEVIDGIAVRRLSPVGLGFRSNILMLGRVLWYLMRHARSYDIIHVHTIGPLGLASAIAGKLTRTPVVMKIATYGDINRKEHTGKPTPQYKAFVRRFLLPDRLWKKLLRQVSVIVAISDAIKKEAVNAGLEVVTIPNGVDTKRFKPISFRERQQRRQDLQLPPTGKLLFYSGRLVARKRVDILLRALPDILDAHPDSYLIIAGSGALQRDSVEEQLRALVQALQIGDHVVFAGMVEDVAAYLQVADVFVFPSEREGMPNAVLEAMATGLPIVASNIGGVIDLVDGDSAWLIPPGDEKAFSATLIEILDDLPAAEHKGRLARKRAEELFSLEAVAMRYVALYQRLLNE